MKPLVPLTIEEFEEILSRRKEKDEFAEDKAEVNEAGELRPEKQRTISKAEERDFLKQVINF